MKDKNRRYRLTGDRSLNDLTQDEFGFATIAKNLSEAIATRISGDGYTIGIEGQWGSGKSTLTNFIIHEAEKSSDNTVVRFEPWLIGEKHTLLVSFFAQLAASLDKVADQKAGIWPQWKRDRTFAITANMRHYANAVALTAAGVSALTGNVWLSIPSKLIHAAGAFLGLWSKNTIEHQKASIVAGLNELLQEQNLRILIVIDDTDRLEPSEAAELLRLIRKVADFPALTYIVCYDANVLANQIKTALNTDGHAFLDKIFQTTIAVPPQEPFALRRLLKKRLTDEFPTEMAYRENDHDREYRKHILFDQWCNVLVHTPRDVARLFDTVSLSWPYVPEGSDFYDFVWLQLLKIKHRDLYKWVQTYLQNVSALRDNGRPGDSGSEEANALKGHLEELGWKRHAYFSGIDSFLPGVKTALVEDDTRRTVYNFSNSDELKRFENNRRLGSPSHWRQYFAFDVPSYAIRDSEFSAFRSLAVEDPLGASSLLTELLARRHDKPGHFLNVFLDRLGDFPHDAFNDQERDGIFSALLSTMDGVDKVAHERAKEGHSAIWNKSARLMLNLKPVDAFLGSIATGKSFNWLAFMLREQGHAHGRNSQRTYPEAQWLSLCELDRAILALEARLRAMPMSDIFRSPQPLDILFFWEQLGDRNILRERFSDAVVDDDHFLEAMKSLQSWSSSDAGVRHPLQARYVDVFYDSELANKRLAMLERSPDEKTRTRATDLVKEWAGVGDI